jgi:hypothetical protein
MRSVFLTAAGFVLAAGQAAAGSSYVLPDGTNRAPAVTLHCVGPNNTAVPCGTAASPLVVTNQVGASSASNQQLQIGAEQSTAQAVGTVNDAAFAGGQGSVVALLKALWSTQVTGVPALSAGGTLTSRTVSLPSGVSTLVFPVNATRHYLSFQVPQGSGVWINLIGGAAAPNAADCAYFSAGTFYESGSFINRGAIAVYAPVAGIFSAWEN